MSDIEQFNAHDVRFNTRGRDMVRPTLTKKGVVAVVACKIKRQEKNISHNDSELEKKKWAKQKHAWIAWTSRIKRGEEKKVSRVTNRPSALKNEHHLE